ASPPISSPLSLHDALPILPADPYSIRQAIPLFLLLHIRQLQQDTLLYTDQTFLSSRFLFLISLHLSSCNIPIPLLIPQNFHPDRSEEHTSELQSRENLVCR